MRFGLRNTSAFTEAVGRINGEEHSDKETTKPDMGAGECEKRVAGKRRSGEGGWVCRFASSSHAVFKQCPSKHTHRPSPSHLVCPQRVAPVDPGLGDVGKTRLSISRHDSSVEKKCRCSTFCDSETFVHTFAHQTVQSGSVCGERGALGNRSNTMFWQASKKRWIGLLCSSLIRRL